MAGNRVFTVYKRILAKLGLQQLDVYRVREGGKLREIIRVRDPALGKTAMISLDTTREAMSPKEFVEKIIEGASRAGISLSERKVHEVLERYLEEQRQA